jgi:hypothetical protein
MSKTSTIKGTLVYKQFITLDDGSEVQVRYNQDKDLYNGTDVTVYEYQASEGSGAERKQVTRYAVAVQDAIRATRTSTKESVSNMLASGLTAEQIVAKLTGKA